jgi:D-beta-D-heptose 7-phosphate kinase/D-beta-D-heptose 1-phosphate adenosyltransferase
MSAPHTDALALPAGFGQARVLILGDVMLDRFVYGRVERMSPEAPIPVLSIQRETAMPGGAGNVARNVASLGGTAVLVGLAGDDRAGADLRRLLGEVPGVTAALVPAAGRPTSEKVRYVADRQQLLRADHEDAAPAEGDAATALLQAFRQHLAGADAVVLSDYAKGVLSDAVLGEAIALARAAGKPVIADPKHRDLSRYDGVTLVTPNRGEAALATGLRAEDDAGTAGAAAAILAAAPAIAAVLVTRGARGMTLAARDAAPVHIRTAAREVFDVSGAGDTVVATLALALAAGSALELAARLANAAASIAVGKTGTATVRQDELAATLQEERVHSTERKVVTLEQAADIVARWRARGERIGFTNGCFDLIHPGHVSLLGQARAACDRLVVGLNTDASIRRLKGPDRPVQDEVARAIVMASLAVVDLVVLFAEDTPLELIRTLRPDVLVKGADYTIDKVVGADLVQSWGGEVLLADLKPGQSTTRTIARIGRGAA